jgi:hypothetical protein
MKPTDGRLRYVAAIVMPIIAAFAVWLAWPRESVPVTRKWGYDLNEHVLFPVPLNALAPFPAPSGDLRGAPAGTPAGVVAVVLRIAGSSQKTIAFLEKGGPTHKMISRIDPVIWYKESSPESAAIAAETRALYDGKSVDQDFPPP